jgi:glycosyltransferase involved in cell wall biosynthesis
MPINLKDKNRILILIPGEKAKGGIPTYYGTLAPLFNLSIDYLERGARNWPEKSNLFSELLRVLKDYLRFIKAIRSGRYSLIVTNTSFSSLAIMRDGLYLMIANFYKLKTIVFFRGWDYAFADKLKRKYFKMFKSVYFKTDAIIDLAQKNIFHLKDWGYEGQTYLETAVVEKNSVREISESQIAGRYLKKDLNLLFLARLERTKGIYEAIDTFVILKKQHPNLKMTIAGEGLESNKIKKYIQIQKIYDITLTGFVVGKRKDEVFAASDFYIFPSYSEGMPSSLVEAMAFGLPIVTSDVGGIKDFFINEKNGYITESKDPVVLASLVNLLIINIDKAKFMALNNYNYAKLKFYADIVVLRMEKILMNVLRG